MIIFLIIVNANSDIIIVISVFVDLCVLIRIEFVWVIELNWLDGR